MTDNESGMDLEEAHFYHIILEFEEIWCKYGADFVLKRHPRLLETVFPDMLSHNGE